MKTESINGTTLHYNERGGGPALALIHGFPLDSRVWEAQVDALSSDFRIIAPDLRGFGQSRSNDGFTMESLADDLHELLEKIGALPCVLAGLSMGGYAALAYVKKYPTDLRGLILVDTRAEGDSPQGKEGRGKMIELVRSEGSAAVANQMMPKMIADADAAGRPQLVKQLRQIMESCPPGTIENALVAMRDRPDFTDDLPSIPVPTLILVGESDAITPPATAESMQKQIPGAALEIIPGAGHMTPMEQPDKMNQIIRRFMEML